MQFETPACTILSLYQNTIRDSRLIRIHFQATQPTPFFVIRNTWAVTDNRQTNTQLPEVSFYVFYVSNFAYMNQVILGAPVLTYLLYTNSYVDILHTRTPFFAKQRLFTVIIDLVKYYNIIQKLELRIRIFFFVGCFKQCFSILILNNHAARATIWRTPTPLKNKTGAAWAHLQWNTTTTTSDAIAIWHLVVHLP